jgi:hypothetical protein
VSNRRTNPFFGIAILFTLAIFFAGGALGQPAKPAVVASPTAFRVGERITYTLSLGRFSDVGYAEVHVASRGTLAGRDVIELRSKFKTLNLVSAAFYEVDEARTVFVDPTSGAPLYAKRTRNPEGLPSETTSDFIKEPANGLDFLSLIYRIRHSGGTGSVNLFENGRLHTVTYSPSDTEVVRTPAGDFDTTIVSIQSDYFTDLGFKEILVNLSNDEARIPAVIRLRTKRYELRAVAASVHTTVPEVEATPAPTPAPTVMPVATPTPARTPEPYVDNQLLSGDLSFQLGESLEYRVTAGGRPVGTFEMRARERRNIGGRDTLVLAATVTNAAGGNPVLAPSDSITAFVDPETLTPRQMDIKLQTGLSSLNQTIIFDARSGAITYRGNNRVDAPVGTHSLLSLIYAMRSFNLRMSKTRDNPVNDTRVAVFWESQPYIFKLRPAAEATIEVNGEKLLALPVSVTTDNPQLDALGLKIWLSTDGRRVPLRFSAGVYQADLVSAANIPLK